MRNSGKIVVLAFPDTYVRHSDEVWCKLLPFFGLGTRTHIKAGHAALVLIHNERGEMRYFDFGRYVTPAGKGRVRGAETDIELAIPFKAVIEDGELVNFEELLLWLEAHPEKTHGSGRLVASVCDNIDYDLAYDYVLSLQAQGSIPYKAFGQEGSNCSRFVTETILASTGDAKIKKALQHNKRFTPSTVGNVEKSGRSIVQVHRGVVHKYTSSALRENLTNYFARRPQLSYTDSPRFELPEAAQKLSGIGSSAYFVVEHFEVDTAIIARYNDAGVLDFRGRFDLPHAVPSKGFDKVPPLRLELPYRFVYDSNCLYCTIAQGGHKYILHRKECLASNSMRRSHSA